jgi:hypothetical protein
MSEAKDSEEQKRPSHPIGPKLIQLSTIENFSPIKPRDARIDMFRGIKRYVTKTKKEAIYQLSFEAKKIKIKEQLLRNISGSYKHIWRMFQARAVVLSLVHNILKKYRVFGIKAVSLNPGKAFAKKNTTKPLRIYKNSTRYKVHALIMLFIFLFALVVFPLDIGFHDRDFMLPLTLATFWVLCYLTADVILRFVIVNFKDGAHIDCLKQMAKSYLKSYFLLDLVGSLPFEFIFTINDHFVLRLLMLARVARMYFSVVSPAKDGEFVSWQIKSSLRNVKLIKVLEALFLTCLILHLSACSLTFLSTLGQEKHLFTK